jgi:hypothetical protein
MFSKLNLKWLAGIFAGLLLIAFFLTLHDKEGSTNRNRSFRNKLTDFDSAQVTSLIISPKSNKGQIILKKEGKIWTVSSNEKKYNADEPGIKNLIGSLISLKPMRVAAKDKTSWNEYEVSDSSSTRVQVFAGNKSLADVYIGKFTYQQPNNANPYVRQQGTLTSFIRVAGDNAVYALDGLLSLTFNRQASDFRNHSILNSDSKNWNKLTFTVPAGSFNLQKQNNKWLIDGMLADSAQVAKYLTSIEHLNNTNFIDMPATDKTAPDFMLNIEGINVPEPIKIRAFKSDTTNLYAISSSLNEGTYFSGKGSDLFRKIFIDKNNLVQHIPAKP